MKKKLPKNFGKMSYEDITDDFGYKFESTKQVCHLKDCKDTWGTSASELSETYEIEKPKEIRKFGKSTRSSDEGKIDYSHVSQISERCFVEYMHEHRIQEDGELREPDNYKYDMPIDTNRKSLLGHFADLKMVLEGHTVIENGKEVTPFECIQAIKFNLQTFDHNLMKGYSFDRKYGSELPEEYNKRFYEIYKKGRFI